MKEIMELADEVERLANEYVDDDNRELPDRARDLVRAVRLQRMGVFG